MAVKKGRRGRGEGSVFYSEAKACWVWRAVTGFKPGGGLRYTEGRASTQAAALKAKQAAEKGNRQPHEDLETVGEHLDHWLENVARPNVRANTFARYEQVVRLHLKPEIGGVPLRKFSVAQTTRLWAKLSRDGMGGGTVKTCSEVLASALEVAVSEGKIPTAPTRGAVKPRVLAKPIEVFADDEVRSIMAAANGHKHEALVVVGIASGARMGELLALEDGDFDPTAGTLKIVKMLDQTGGRFTIQPPKSASGVRSISLPTFAVDVLKRHLAKRTAGPIFTTRTGGYIPKSNFIRRDWTELLAAAGVPYRKFHTLRHTHASRLLADGVDPAEVAKRLGDRIETVMRVYAHWVETNNRDTAAKIEAIYGPTRPRLALLPTEDGREDENSQSGGKVANPKAI